MSVTGGADRGLPQGAAVPGPGRAAGWRARRLLLLGAVALLTAWAFVVPVFEAPDEHLHWQYARHLHDHAVLPIYGPHFAEANSPPLYMFPALPAVMLAAALGLRGWRPWAGPGGSGGSGGRGALWPVGFTLAAWAAANVAILLFVVRPVYYPPLVASLSRAVTLVKPSLSAGGLEWAADVRVPATDASFIWFDVVPQGHHPAGTVAGTVVFTLEGSEVGAGEHRVPFQWRGGRETRPVVMMLKDPRSTSGTMTRVSVRLPDSASFAIRNLQLMGSLPGNNY